MAAKKKTKISTKKVPHKDSVLLIQVISVLFFIISLASLFSLLQNVFSINENLFSLSLSILLLFAAAGLWIRKTWGLILTILALLLEIFYGIIHVTTVVISYNEIALRVIAIVFVASIILYLYTKKDLFD